MLSPRLYLWLATLLSLVLPAGLSSSSAMFFIECGYIELPDPMMDVFKANDERKDSMGVRGIGKTIFEEAGSCNSHLKHLPLIFFEHFYGIF